MATVRVNPSNVPVLKRQPAVTSFEMEFETVDIVLASHAETRGVDAFALSLIKCERQARRLLTHIVFQFPCFSAKNIPALRSALSDNKGVYFEGVIRGIDHLYPLTVQELVGHDYLRLIHRLNEAIDHRNKLFHGQLTSKYLTRVELLDYVADIRCWCRALAEAAHGQLGYDGFERDSFRKARDIEMSKRYRNKLSSVDSYVHLIKTHMRRR